MWEVTSCALVRVVPTGSYIRSKITKSTCSMKARCERAGTTDTIHLRSTRKDYAIIHINSLSSSDFSLIQDNHLLVKRVLTWTIFQKETCDTLWWRMVMKKVFSCWKTSSRQWNMILQIICQVACRWQWWSASISRLVMAFKISLLLFTTSLQLSAASMRRPCMRSAILYLIMILISWCLLLGLEPRWTCPISTQAAKCITAFPLMAQRQIQIYSNCRVSCRVIEMRFLFWLSQGPLSSHPCCERQWVFVRAWKRMWSNIWFFSSWLMESFMTNRR